MILRILCNVVVTQFYDLSHKPESSVEGVYSLPEMLCIKGYSRSARHWRNKRCSWTSRHTRSGWSPWVTWNTRTFHQGWLSVLFLFCLCLENSLLQIQQTKQIIQMNSTLTSSSLVHDKIKNFQVEFPWNLKLWWLKFKRPVFHCCHNQNTIVIAQWICHHFSNV